MNLKQTTNGNNWLRNLLPCSDTQMLLQALFQPVLDLAFGCNPWIGLLQELN